MCACVCAQGGGEAMDKRIWQYSQSRPYGRRKEEENENRKKEKRTQVNFVFIKFVWPCHICRASHSFRSHAYLIFTDQTIHIYYTFIRKHHKTIKLFLWPRAFIKLAIFSIAFVFALTSWRGGGGDMPKYWNTENRTCENVLCTYFICVGSAYIGMYM